MLLVNMPLAHRSCERNKTRTIIIIQKFFFTGIGNRSMKDVR